jgi:ribosomal protein L29
MNKELEIKKLQKRVSELETDLRDVNKLLFNYRNYLKDGNVDKVIASITQILIEINYNDNA